MGCVFFVGQIGLAALRTGFRDSDRIGRGRAAAAGAVGKCVGFVDGGTADRAGEAVGICGNLVITGVPAVVAIGNVCSSADGVVAAVIICNGDGGGTRCGIFAVRNRVFACGDLGIP